MMRKEGSIATTRVHRMPGIIPGQRQSAPKPKPSKTPFVIICLGVVVGGIYWFVFAGPAFAVQQVEVSGIQNSAIQALGQQFVGQNIFRLHTETVADSIQAAYPPVASVTLVRGIPHTLRIAVQLRTPVLRWQVDQTTFILDSNGQAFATGDQEAYKDLPLIVDFSHVNPKLGQEVVSSAFIEFVQEINSSIPTTLNKKVVHFEVHDTIFQIDAMLEGDVRLRLTSQRPAKEQLDGAKAILQAHPKVHLLDMRVPGRGYYV